ncbi:putative ATP-dependent DNA helicase YjcD [Lachnospiraceae bacterium]|jgi:DNA helicase-2/ATP-dependent DNA helicase PcrA|nr:ATP-dependent helicase [Dorea sp.]GFI36869.1 putative ATP-dependent DNA helicase YjcD [Lachnospiraceae bacterium]
MSLNSAQKEAVAHYQGPCMVLAGPGSGKTLTIAKRIEYLLKVYKVRPEEILVITFTKYAASEMRRRFDKVMGGHALPVTFGTFHGIYYGILKWAYGLTSANLLSEKERKLLLRQASERIPEEGEEILFRDEDSLQKLSEEIANVKNNRMKIEEYESGRYGTGRFRQVYQNYEDSKKKLNKLDFEDMLTWCCRLFEDRPDILEKWQHRFRYFLVDEFQDINQAQYDVLRMLAASSRNLFVVGDDDQSVYGFRGARPGIMQEFMKDYQEAGQIVLDVNYRSGAHIVRGALRVIENNRNRYPKAIRAYKGSGQEIHVQEVRDPFEESRYITEQIKECLESGISPGEIAVLYRTCPDAGVLAEALMEYQIPFQMKERMNNLYEHFIGVDIESYFRLSQGRPERKHFLQVANRPNRYIGRDSMDSRTVSYESLRNFYCDKKWMLDRIDQLEWDMKMICGKTPYAAIEYIRKSIGYNEFLKEYADYRGMEQEDLFPVLDEIQERSRGIQTIRDWFLHVEEYKDLILRQSGQETYGQGVSLLTMHGAKGLEYDTVFIPGANEGVTPYKKAVMEEETEEERRLFYVAMTRAKRQLTISYVKEKNGKDMQPSRFVNELLKNL